MTFTANNEYDVSAEVQCGTTSGPFKFHLYRSWSPNGVDRTIELFEKHFFDNSHFFRVVHGFLVQFGISYTTDPALRNLGNTNIQDDPQLIPPIKFEEGIISYAGSGPNSRSSQMFIAYGPVASLGKELWETPIGKVVEGMENVRSFYAGYGEMPPWGKGPEQNKIRNKGLAYMEEGFPKMDSFLECTLVRTPSDAEKSYPQHIRKTAPNVLRKSFPEDTIKLTNTKPTNIHEILLIVSFLFIVFIAGAFKMSLRWFRKNKLSKSN